MLEKQLYDFLVKRCDLAVQSILTFDNHKIPKEVQHLYKESTERHKSIINNLVFYKWNEDTTFLEAYTDLLIAMVKQHSLYNGNKRTAMILLYLVIWELGDNLPSFVGFERIKWINLLNKIAVSNNEEIYQEFQDFICVNMLSAPEKLFDIFQWRFNQHFIWEPQIDSNNQVVYITDRNTFEYPFNEDDESQGFIKLINKLSEM